METSIKKYSEIGLILFDLLNQDYDCTKKCIKTLKNVEKHIVKGLVVSIGNLNKNKKLMS